MEKTMIIGIIILTFIIWSWAIIDLLKSEFKNLKIKAIWLIIILFFPIIGSIIYFQLRKELTKNEPQKFQPNFDRVNASCQQSTVVKN